MMTIRSLRRRLNWLVKLLQLALLGSFINAGKPYLLTGNIIKYVYSPLKCQYQDFLIYCVDAIKVACLVHRSLSL